MKRIETERLILRTPELLDASDMFEYAQSERVGPYAGWKPHESVQESENILTSMIKSGEVWAIEYKENHKMIGTIGLHRDTLRLFRCDKSNELGYVLSPLYHGRGIMKEAVIGVLSYAFLEKGNDTVAVAHFDFNTCSRRLIEKLGFTYEGRVRMAYECEGFGICDTLVYSMTKEEYKKLYENIRCN